MGNDRTTRIVTASVVALLLVLLIYPLTKILSESFSAGGRDVLLSVITNRVNRQVVINTVVLGICAGGVGTAIGVLFAFAQVRLTFRGKRVLHWIALMPIVSPPFALATAIIVLFGRNGMISNGIFGYQLNIYGLKGLVIVLSVSFFPVAYMNVLGMMQSLNPALDEAASDLGASKWKIVRTITLPMLVPGIASSFLLLFVESIADLANPLVLGGDYTVLASKAFLAITGQYNVAAGAAYSFVLLLPALLVFLIQRYWVSRKNVVSVTGKPTGNPVEIDSGAGRLVIIGIALFVAALVILLYATVIWGAFVKILGVDNSLTLKNFRYIFSGLGTEAITDTTTLALIAMPIAGLLGMVIAWLVVRKLRRSSGAMDFLGMLGLAVPGTVIGIGYALAFNHGLIVGNRMFLPALAGGGAVLGGAAAIVMVYTIRSMPSGLRAGVGALQQIDPAIDEASASLGASGVTTFRRVTLPLIRPAFIAGLSYAFARSMTTISPIIFITTPETKIMTSQILNEVDAVRYGYAFAYCTILIAIVLVVMALLAIFVKRRASTSGVTSVIAVGGAA